MFATERPLLAPLPEEPLAGFRFESPAPDRPRRGPAGPAGQRFGKQRGQPGDVVAAGPRRPVEVSQLAVAVPRREQLGCRVGHVAGCGGAANSDSDERAS